jgi:hypothetical protein
MKRPNMRVPISIVLQMRVCALRRAMRPVRFAVRRGQVFSLESIHPGMASPRQLALRLEKVDAKLPTRDPEYDSEKEKNRLHMLETVKMARLEVQHAEYLEPYWKPNDDWWGSQVTVD